METVYIGDLDKAAVLAWLFNCAHPFGMGFYHYQARDMAPDEAQKILDSGQTYFDYYEGRLMKVDLKGDEIRSYLWDQDYGDGSLQRAVDRLRREVTRGEV